MKFPHTPFLLVALAVSLTLSACTPTLSQLSPDGRSDRIVFADPSNAWLAQGTFPSTDSLRGVAPGMSKPQLYEMFGRPHFQEGMVGVHEWDYLFHFRKDDGGVADCQYKLVFDAGYRVRSTHWRDPACAKYLVVKKPEPVVVEKIVEKLVPALAAPVEPRRERISADTLFAYDKSGLADLLPGGVSRLDQLVGELRSSGEFDRVTVVGHTDDIGGTGYNLALSNARAATVRAYLVAKGIPGSRIEASGLGEAVSLVTCPAGRRAARIKCLAPNRRVEVETWMRPVR